MTLDEVKDLADTTLRPVLGEGNVERIVVQEQDDWTGDPALYIDVFVAPDMGVPSSDGWREAKHRLSDRLIARGEKRFPFVSLTDRNEQAFAEAELRALE